MEQSKFYLSEDGEQYAGSGYATREEAVAAAPLALHLNPGAKFWTAQGFMAPSRLTAAEVVEMLDRHAVDDGWDGHDPYGITSDAEAELEKLLDAWAAKHDVRPRWYTVEDEQEHTVPEQTEVSHG